MSMNANPNVFANSPLDRCGHRRQDKAWLDEALQSEASQLVLFQKMAPFCDANGPVWLTGAARDALCGASALTLFLGVDASGLPHFAVEMGASKDVADLAIADLGAFEDMRAVAARITGGDAAILGCAKGLFEWHARHGFCANCGAQSEPVDGGWKRVCTPCGSEHFPRVDPVVIMLPVKGDHCCLGRQARFPPGMFSAFAGFVEPGESLEEACRREIHEEAGLNAIAIEYHSTQPWPFPSSLMVGLIAQVEDFVIHLDDDEIEEAIWLTREEARAALNGGAIVGDGKKIWAPPALAIAHQLLKHWVEVGAES
jgi:NAD+ diphosphatase